MRPFSFVNRLSPRNLPNEDTQLLLSLHDAKREWWLARARFEQVSDPDLIDQAIYQLEAAQRRYDYLLKCAKQRGLVCPAGPQVRAHSGAQHGHDLARIRM